MAKKAFDKIMDGLTDALAYAEGDKSRGKVHEVEVPAVDVSAKGRAVEPPGRATPRSVSD